MGEAENLAGTEVRGDFLLVDVLLELVRQQHHDPVGLGCRIGNTQNFEAVGFGFVS